MPDEVARIGALSNGSNGQRSLESASLHFEPICRREGGAADREPTGEILSRRRRIYSLLEADREHKKAEREPALNTEGSELLNHAVNISLVSVPILAATSKRKQT